MVENCCLCKKMLYLLKLMSTAASQAVLLIGCSKLSSFSLASASLGSCKYVLQRCQNLLCISHKMHLPALVAPLWPVLATAMVSWQGTADVQHQIVPIPLPNSGPTQFLPQLFLGIILTFCMPSCGSTCGLSRHILQSLSVAGDAARWDCAASQP